MKKNVLVALSGVLFFSFILTSCINGVETEVVPVTPAGGSGISEGKSDGNAGEKSDVGQFGDKELAALLLEIGRGYDGVLQKLEEGNGFDGGGSREGGVEAPDEGCDFDEEYSEFLKNKLDEIYPSYMKTLDFFLSFLRIDDCRESFLISENIELKDIRFSQIKNIFDLLKEHYEGNYNSDYYFPTFEEAFKSYENYLSVFNKTSEIENLELDVEIKFNSEASAFELHFENLFDISVLDFNGMLKELFSELNEGNDSLPIQSVVIKNNGRLDIAGDYAVVKETVKDINLDGTLDTVAKLNLVMDSLENFMLTADIELDFVVKTADGRNLTLGFEPSVYLEKSDYDFIVDTVMDKNTTVRHKISEIGKKDIYITVSVEEAFHQIYTNTFTLYELFELYIKEVK